MLTSSRRFLPSIAVATGALVGASVLGLNRALTSSRNTANDDWRTVSPQPLGWEKDRQKSYSGKLEMTISDCCAGHGARGLDRAASPRNERLG
jgi:hypothetical protein